MHNPTLAGPPRLRSSKRRFWTVLPRVVQIAAAVDVGFFALFWWFDSPLLAWINVVSVAIYAGAWLALRRRYNRLAIVLIWSEVLGHAAIGTLMAGWDSGFHYYLLMFIPAIFVSIPLRRAVPAALVLWGFYVGLDVAMETLPVREPLARDALLVVRWFNVSVVFAMFAYLSRFYLQLANDAESRLRTLATTDPLTRLFNRRYILELAAREAGEHGRAPPAFLMADIDHFKNVNDDHGHDGGDIALAAVGEAIRRSVREPDSVARWGGEEFLVLLPSTGLDVAARIAERIRQEVQSLELDVRSRPLRLTLTLGVSTLRSNEGVNDAISRADAALYRGKELGRNRVVTETMLTG